MRAFFAFVCGAGILASVVSAQADKRVAFFVGNSAYKHVAELPNPSLDAKAMAGLLRNAGFDVVEGTDLGRDAMTGKLRDFALKTQGAEVALFVHTHVREDALALQVVNLPVGKDPPIDETAFRVDQRLNIHSRPLLGATLYTLIIDPTLCRQLAKLQAATPGESLETPLSLGYIL